MRNWQFVPTFAFASFSCVNVVIGETVRPDASAATPWRTSISASPSDVELPSSSPVPLPTKSTDSRDIRGGTNRGVFDDGLSRPEVLSHTQSSLSDQTNLDLSQVRSPSASGRSLSQFASTNRSSAAFRATNMFGDFFGGKSGVNKFVIPVKLQNLQGFDSGLGVFNFVLPGETVPAFTSVGPADPKGNFEVSAPNPQSGAYAPANDGLQGFFFGGGKAVPLAPGGDTSNSAYDVTYFFDANTLLPANTTALYGRQKIAENVSPIPRNRIFVNYSYFDNTPLAGGLDVKRWAPGFESLIGSELSSIEVRLPMATTLSSNVFDEGTDFSNHEIGNLYFAFKHLFYQDEQNAISAGCSFTAPTGDDINVFVHSDSFGNRKVLEIQNESVHVLPFLGWFAGSGRLFTQGFCQLDIDTNGNTVNYNPNFLQEDLMELGRLQDSNFWYLDIQTGYWLHQAHGHLAKRGLTGAAVISELHWNRSLNAEDVLSFPNGMSFFVPRSDVQILNALFGLNLVFNSNSNIGLGYALPIGNGVDQEFKGEGRFIFNRYF